jgi:hypothetical protein
MVEMGLTSQDQAMQIKPAGRSTFMYFISKFTQVWVFVIAPVSPLQLHGSKKIGAAPDFLF